MPKQCEWIIRLHVARPPTKHRLVEQMALHIRIVFRKVPMAYAAFARLLKHDPYRLKKRFAVPQCCWRYMLCYCNTSKRMHVAAHEVTHCW